MFAIMQLPDRNTDIGRARAMLQSSLQSFAATREVARRNGSGAAVYLS
jgi:hypothetical protein